MILPEEIQNAAQALGKSLRKDDFLRPYLNAVEKIRTDPEVSQLEEQLYAAYNALIARQKAGELLSHEDRQPFNDLRRRVQTHPLISKREEELRSIKSYLAYVADEISASLGADYTTLARPG